MERRKIIILILVVMIIVVLNLIFLLVIQMITPQSVCGNGICERDESWQTCPEDCEIPAGEEAICGDGVCEKEENRINCPSDCGPQHTFCGDGVCEMPETIENCPEDCIVISWLKDYASQRIRAGISNRYLEETNHFDYSSRNIMELVYDIGYNTGSAEEAVKRTAREVYLRVDYVADLSIWDCTSNSASEVLAREYGLCSTMSKVNVAILRGMGIAARPVVGCGSNLGSCHLLTILPGVELPKINPIRIEDGIGVRGGGLHAWVEVWLPEEGWVLLESTNGRVYEDPKCTSYDIELYPTTIKYLCASYDLDYINACEDESLFR